MFYIKEGTFLREKKVKEIYITLDPPPMEENVLKLKSLTDTEC